MNNEIKKKNPEFWYLGFYGYPYYKWQLQNLFKSHIKKSFLILDAGCGPNGGYLAKTPVNVTSIGLDISRKNIEKSIRTTKGICKNKPLFIVGDIGKMPFDEEAFDVIICQDVLEHVKGKENVISEIAFSLKRGGKILISTTNGFNPEMFFDDILPMNVSDRIIRALGDDCSSFYKRQGRLNPWNLRKKLIKHGIIMNKILMTGYPPIGKPWMYHDLQMNPPIIYYLWIFFNQLTDIHFFQNFKEIMIVVAEKICVPIKRERKE